MTHLAYLSNSLDILLDALQEDHPSLLASLWPLHKWLVAWVLRLEWTLITIDTTRSSYLLDQPQLAGNLISEVRCCLITAIPSVA